MAWHARYSNSIVSKGYILDLTKNYNITRNIIGELDDRETVYTWRAIHFYISDSHYEEVSTISNMNLNIESSSDYTSVASTIGSQHTSEEEVKELLEVTIMVGRLMERYATR